MNTQKLREALVELRHQRALLDNAIANLEGILSTLNGVTPEPSVIKGKSTTGSYVDLSVRILEESGKPMHITEIAKKVSEIKGRNIPRASVESSLLRHMQTTKGEPRVTRVRPAYFGLPVWKSFAKEPVAMTLNLNDSTR